MDILKNLNSKQKEAVQISSGPILVVAGPGSGKTKTLTHRIAYLIAKGTPAHNILAVTFTNKAANEMKVRVQALLEPAADLRRPERRFTQISQPLIGTFHSICARILRREAHELGYTPNFTIYDEEDALKLIKNVMREALVDQKQFPPAKIRAKISSLKDDLLSPEDYEIEAQEYFPRIVYRVYAAYQKLLKSQNALDFDDLLMKTVELFEKNQKTLQKYRTQFQHVLIDEFQDTNLSQYKIASLLTKEHRNIYCIGDLDQSIYSFRGADYRNILRFEKDWPDAAIITLGQNYRSTQNILDAAGGVISRNRSAKKNLWTENGRGGLLVLKETEDEISEGDFIVSEIKKLAQEKRLKLQDFVVLYRTNAQSRAIEEAFLRNSLPYNIIGGIKFYQRKEVKDMLAWLRLCINPDDAMAMYRVSGIPAKFFQPPASPNERGEPLAKNSKPPPRRRASPSFAPTELRRTNKAQKINFLIKIFTEKSKKYKITKLLEYIIKDTGFEEYLRDGTDKGEERWDNVKELMSVALKYNSEEPGSAIRMLIEESALAQETDGIKYEKDVINLMTLHSVKGLEFSIVFMAGCEQGLLPHSRSLFSTEENDTKEERRLCYVGITRAKHKIYLIFTQSRLMFGKIQSNPPSEFLQDIPEHLVEFIPAENTERVIELD